MRRTSPSRADLAESNRDQHMTQEWTLILYEVTATHTDSSEGTPAAFGH